MDNTFLLFDVQSMGSPPLYARGLRGLFGLPHFLGLDKKCILKQTRNKGLSQLFLTAVMDLPQNL